MEDNNFERMMKDALDTDKPSHCSVPKSQTCFKTEDVRLYYGVHVVKTEHDLTNCNGKDVMRNAKKCLNVT